MALLKGVQVPRFVVWDLVEPSAIEDTNPLERQGSDGGVVGSALGLVRLVEGAGPERAWNVTCPPKTNPSGRRVLQKSEEPGQGG